MNGNCIAKKSVVRYYVFFSLYIVEKSIYDFLAVLPTFMVEIVTFVIQKF